MAILPALRIGWKQVNQTKRMVVFAWLVNVTITLIVAVPMLITLNNYIQGSVMEQSLLEQIDSNWFQTFRFDNQENDLVQNTDYSIFGYAPFLTHYQSYLNGFVVKNIGNFFFDLIFKWRLGLEYLGTMTILAFVYVLVSTFLSGGFIGTYAKSYRLSFQEFLVEGAKYFGKFFRLSLLSLIVYVLLFEIIFDWWTGSIRAWTANERSEMVPFVHYMIKNGVALLVLGLVTLCFDYAKIRMVVDDRISAIFAFWAGVKFVFKHFLSTSGLYILLSLVGVVFIVLYALVEGAIDQTGYWTILTVFVIQQIYMLARLCLKATFYASQTQLYQATAAADHQTDLAAEGRTA